MPVIAQLFAVVAALIHVWFFVMESVLWRRPSVWARFRITSQADADTIASAGGRAWMSAAGRNRRSERTSTSPAPTMQAHANSATAWPTAPSPEVRASQTPPRTPSARNRL